MTPEERTALLFKKKAPPRPLKKRSKERFFKQGDPHLRESLSALDSTYVTLLAHRAISGATSLDACEQHHEVLLLPLSDVLAESFDKDSHIQPFHSSEIFEPPYSVRLNKGLNQVKIETHCIVFDWDREPKEKWKSEDDFLNTVTKMTESPMLKGAVIYQTRNGLRALRPFSTPFINGSNSGEGWKVLYTHMLTELPRVEGGEWDASVSDYTRLFRLPFVRRDGRNERGLIYVPRHIETLTLTSKHEALCITAEVKSALGKGKGKTQGTKGLVEFFDKIGMLGEEIKELNGSPAYIATCPYEHLHSSSTPSSTILMNTEDGYVLHCKHASCRDALSGNGYLRDLKTKFSEEWGETCENENTPRYVYDPHNHTQFLNNAITLLKRVFPDEMFRWEDSIVTLETNAWGYVKFRVWTDTDLCGVLNRSADWEILSTDKDGNVKSKPTSVPLSTVKLATSEICRSLPVLRGKTVLPPIDLDYCEPTRYTKGYCPETGLYFLPAPSVDTEVFEQRLQSPPSREKAIQAFLRIRELFSDFPFKSSEQVTLAVSAVLTAFLRRSIDAPAPLFFVSANSKGVGKTKLMQAVLAGVYGFTPSLTSLPEKDEETRKLMDSLLFEDVDYCLLDNVAGGLGSANLDALITSDRYRSRMLGSSMTVEKPVRFFLGATGNNSTLKGDTDRRAIMIRLVTELENPEERKGFRFPDLLKEARKRQTEIWISCLEILRAYGVVSTLKERQEIEEKKRALGSFETWCEVVRDPLMWVARLLYPQSETTDVVTLSAEEIEYSRGDTKGDVMDCLIEFQQSLNRAYMVDSYEWTVKELSDALKQAETTGDDNLQTFAGMISSTSISYLGRLLSNKRDVVHDGWILKNKKTKKKRVNVLEPLEKREPLKEEPLKEESLKEESIEVENLPVDQVTVIDVPEKTVIKVSDSTLAFIDTQFQVKTRQDEIARLLNEKKISPPSGVKWTSAKVGAVIRSNGLKREKPKKKTNTEKLVEKKGQYKGYYPKDHPTQITLEGEGVLWQVQEDNLDGLKTIDTNALLTRLVGFEMNPVKLFRKGMKRRQEALDEQEGAEQ